LLEDRTQVGVISALVAVLAPAGRALKFFN
jgi:hypothetical protein